MLTTLETGINDRGSRYAVSGGPARTMAEVEALLAGLKREKRFAKATHNSWGVILFDDGVATPIKNDDGEAGAGALLLRMLEGAGVTEHLLVVTRWYGGRHLGGDRFRHVKTAGRLYLATLSEAGRGG